MQISWGQVSSSSLQHDKLLAHHISLLRCKGHGIPSAAQCGSDATCSVISENRRRQIVRLRRESDNRAEYRETKKREGEVGKYLQKEVKKSDEKREQKPKMEDRQHA